MTDYRTYRIGKTEMVLGTMILAAFISVIGILFYDTPLTIVLTPLFMKPAAHMYSGVMAERRLNDLREEFRDLLDSLAASFAGGRHMKEALKEAEKELSSIYSEDEDIIIEVRNMLKRMEEGETDAEVLTDFAERTGVEDIELFKQVFTTCRETGGDLISAMTQASGMLGDKIKIETEIRALTSQKKTEGAVISVMPVIIIVFLRMIAPEYVSVLYGNPMGILLMTIALSGTGAAFYMIKRITDIEI